MATKSYFRGAFRDSERLFVLGMDASPQCFHPGKMVEPGPHIEERLLRVVNDVLRPLVPHDRGACEQVVEMALEALGDKDDDFEEEDGEFDDTLDDDDELGGVGGEAGSDEYEQAVGRLKAMLDQGKLDPTELPLLLLEVETVFSEAQIDYLVPDLVEHLPADEMVFCGGLDMMGVGGYGESHGFVVLREPRDDDDRTGPDFLSRAAIRDATVNAARGMDEAGEILALIERDDDPDALAAFLDRTKWAIRTPIGKPAFGPLCLYDRSVLEACLIRDRLGMAKVLWDRGAGDETFLGNHGSSALEVAAEHGAERCIRHLLEARPPDLKTNGLHLLSCAACGGIRWLVEQLLAAGVPAAGKDRDGGSPIEGALLRARDLDIVAMLVRAGADLNGEDAEGERLLDLWEEDEDPRERRALEGLGARFSD